MIELGPYLSRLCEAMASSMIGDHRPISLKARVRGGGASSSHAVGIGLIVTELIINAVKHAFPDYQKDGAVVVEYDSAAPNWRLSVSDNGAGGPQGGSDRTNPGLGTAIVKALAKQLNARVEVSIHTRGRTVSITHAPFSSRLPAAA